MSVNVTRQFNSNVIVQISSPSSALGRHLRQKAIMVESGAKRGISQSPTRVDTGNLRASIGVNQISSGRFNGYRIGTNVNYAIYVHEGTTRMRANPFMTRGVQYAFSGR